MNQNIDSHKLLIFFVSYSKFYILVFRFPYLLQFSYDEREPVKTYWLFCGILYFADTDFLISGIEKRIKIYFKFVLNQIRVKTELGVLYKKIMYVN